MGIQHEPSGFVSIFFVNCECIDVFECGIGIVVCWSVVKGAMTSFVVMSKEVAHSIQNRLLYLLVKSQG